MNIQNPSPSAATHSTRRSFLQAAGAALASPILVSAAAGETRKIKVGLIGCGSVSRMYLPHLAASPWVELVSVYFNPHGHEGRNEQRHTLSIVGTHGAMGLVGYDWEPGGVELATPQNPEFKRFAIEQNGYRWEEGASVAAECLATGREPLFTAGHAVHVCEIMIAARESQASGRRIPLQTTFQWPVVS